MTAICSRRKTATKKNSWSAIFTSLDTETTSTLFMKKLTATCISTVLCFRNIFPETFFESEIFEGVSLRILKKGEEQSFAGRIQQWLEGAFEAIDKKYLKHLMLDIQDAKTNMTLEIYTITFTYKQDEALNFLISTTQDSKNCGFTEWKTKSNTLNLLQMCSALTRTSGNLPSQITIAMGLSYHENTPEDYQPKGYTAWRPQDLEFLKPTRSVEIGVAETPHHHFKFINKSCLNGEFFKSVEMDGQFTNSFQSL